LKTTRFPQTASGVTERMTGFMAHLRANGLSLGVAETAGVLRSLQQIDVTDHHEVRLACKVACTSHSDDFDRFDELFNAYWFNRGREKSAIAECETQRRQRAPSVFQPGVDSAQPGNTDGDAESPDDDTAGEAQSSGDGRLIASMTSNREKVDFRELMTPESIREAEIMAARLASAMRDRRSRRKRAARRGSQLDMRRILRASLAHGGVPLRLYPRTRPDRPVKIVALLDVSGSMAVYARVFLAFLKGLISHDLQTDAYLFHTALVRISDVLRDHDTFRSINRLSLMAQGFGGGTRIGANLNLFNQQYAARTVGGRSVVIILSDGYDTDSPEHTAQALARLKKRGCRIVWLNPLKGWRDYAPVAGCMAAALPHIDHFAAANTLSSLAALESQFERL
jgi:uncharacterized protein with von Willebrand factor type A (vWA) domain